MTRVDFAFGAPDRLRVACRVVRKHYLAGRELLVYTRDAQLLERFDLLLWGFDASAFVPHVAADDPLAPCTPVRLTSEAPVAGAVRNGQASWLVNLDTQCPPDVGQFERVLEIVSDSDDDKQAARERWRQYQAAGHTLHAHDMAKRAKT